MEAETTTGERSLRREIGVVLGIGIVVNSTIGTGIFRKPAEVARLSGSIEASLLVWVLGAVIALCGALSLAELAAALPRTGGLYEYLRRAYGRPIAFLVGWTKLTLLMPSAVGSFARLAAEAIAAFAGWPEDATRDTGVAMGVVALAVTVNVAGVRASALQQGILTTMKYAGVAALAVVGLLLPFAPSTAPPAETTFSWVGIFAALVSVMWAYDGWADLSNMAGETKDPGKTLPRALILGTAAIGVVYLLANLGYARVLGHAGLAASTTGTNMAAANLAEATLGSVGRSVLSVLICISCIGGCMASLLTGSRMLVPMASDGLFVRALGAVSPRTGVPTRAVLVAGVLGCSYVAFRSFEQLTDGFVVGYFPFYMLGVGALFVLRRREPDLARPFRVPLFPLPPIVFLLGATALLVGAFGDLGETAWLSFGVMLLGLPVGWAWQRFGK